ncbi:hypothetical protein CFC21_053938 [Triticum aestivum]|uniref:Uncharacterized protein n=2 Tax=Triticum aestivum TaxID=4565 RepID=A0A9R1GDB0_WHEAT|nr:uncharacterized protein LOC123087474 [Triticum aestivum]KAF7044749.1 hypothetical protein CFC21_053938 [Triticum aestivum]
MAAVRHAMRRLGGSLLWPTATSPAAAAPRRLTHSESLASEQARHEEVLRKVQQKTDELYDVLCEAERDFCTSSWRNTRMLQHLSMRVTPRPWDWRWRIRRFNRRFHNVAELAGFISLYFGLEVLKQEVEEKEKHAAEATTVSCPID